MTSKTAVCHICSWWNGEQKCGRHTEECERGRQAGAGWAKGTVLKAGLKIDTHSYSSTLHIQPHKTRPACPIMESAHGRHACVQLALRTPQEHGGRSGGRQAVQHPQTAAPHSQPRYNWAVVQVQLGPQRKAMLVFSPHNTDITLTDLHMQNCEATGIPPQLTHSL